jgi:hypothetical protein
VEIGEKLSQLQLILFTGAMKDNNFASSSCSNGWSKHSSTFIKNDLLFMLYNFGIESFVGFYLSFWTFSRSNLCKWNKNGRHRAPARHAYARARDVSSPRPRCPGLPLRPVPQGVTPKAARGPSALEPAPAACRVSTRTRTEPAHVRWLASHAPAATGPLLCSLFCFAAKVCSPTHRSLPIKGHYCPSSHVPDAPPQPLPPPPSS